MNLRVEMNQGDIDAGVPGDACGCPVANASDRAAKEAGIAYDGYVITTCVDVEIDVRSEPGGSTGEMNAPLPEEVREWIDEYDKHRPVEVLEPFELVFEPRA